MAFFPIYRYRRHDNPIDRYFGDQLDFFDPWQDLTTPSTTLVIIPDDFRWINQPKNSESLPNNAKPTAQQNQQTRRSANAQKFRVQLNVAGFNPETIQTKIEGQKVVVEAKQEDRLPDGDFNIRQLRKSYPLPDHADVGHLVSYVTPNKILVVEVPICNPEAEHRLSEAKKGNQNLSQFGQHRDAHFDYQNFLSGSDFTSKIVDKGDNKKQLEMTIEMKNYKPDEIKVSVKNNELIVKGEHRHQDDKQYERTFFFKSTTLPPGTQVEHLQSHLTEDGHLKIEAPYVEQQETAKAVEDKKE